MTAGAAGPVDVAIVGGGIVGAASAAFLAEAGVRVALHEASEIAAAASGRNSGVVQHPLDPVLADLYRETVGHYRQLAEMAGLYGFSLPAEPAGLLALGTDDATARRIAATWSATHGTVPVEVIGGAELRRLEPGLAPDLVACRLGIGFPVGPAAATRAFSARAEAAGALVRIGGAARVVLDEGRARGVEARGELVPAGAVLVAAGPWTPEVVDPFSSWRPIVRSWGVVSTIRLNEPPRHVLEEAAIDIEPDDAGAGELGFSLVPAGRESTLGSTFLRAEPVPAERLAGLVRRGSRFLPAIAQASVLGLRSCARPVSLDGRPLVGAVPGVERLFVAAGHGPWGISTGPATARLVADLILGRGSGIPPGLDAARFGAARPVV